MALTADDNTFTDLSGTSASNSGNPYDPLIETCSNDPERIRQRYRTHREARNEQQRAKILDPNFLGFLIDPVLEKLTARNSDFVDPRNCLVFWARPPQRIQELVHTLQQKLLKIAPSLWIMPLENLHMTVLEIAHSKTESGIESLVNAIGDKAVAITNHPRNHRARLVQPMLSYDAAAIALSFMPSAGEDSLSTASPEYTYHHLRRDVHQMSSSSGIDIGSRYTVPSSHLTIARFVTQEDITNKGGGGIDSQRVSELVNGLEEINAELRSETIGWTIGEEKGLDFRKGKLWYGGGETVHLGQGFYLDHDDR